MRADHLGGFGRPHVSIGLAMPIGPHLLAQGGEKVRVGVYVATIGVLHECGYRGRFHEVAEVRREGLGEVRERRLPG